MSAITTRDIFENAVKLRQEIRVEYLKSIHQSSDTNFVNKAEAVFFNRTFKAVEGMSYEQELLLDLFADLCEVVRSLSNTL